MAKLKYKKLPKKPKANASIATKESYLRKVAEIKKYNSDLKKTRDYGKTLSERISRVSSSDVVPGSGVGRRVPGTRKRKNSGKKKAAKKGSRRKKR